MTCVQYRIIMELASIVGMLLGFFIVLTVINIKDKRKNINKATKEIGEKE